jgi:hypothetical protein
MNSLIVQLFVLDPFFGQIFFGQDIANCSGLMQSRTN